MNFIPSPKFRIRFGTEQNPVYAISYSFHGTTSVLCTLPECNAPAGVSLVAAANDGVVCLLILAPFWSLCRHILTLLDFWLSGSI
jgi:hypothetical protein